MNRLNESWRETIEATTEELQALPTLSNCPMGESIRALTRSHLEIAMKLNENRVTLPLDCDIDKDRANRIVSDYRQLTRSRLSPSPQMFVHSARITSGKHRVAPELCFLSEVSSRSHDGAVVWYCHTPSGFIRYHSGPAVTHVTTPLHISHAHRGLSDFSATPLLSSTAFQEDLKRIHDTGARLAIGLGEPSYILSLALMELNYLKPSKWGFQPSCIGSITVDVQATDTAMISITTTSLGTFLLRAKHAETGECMVSVINDSPHVLKKPVGPY